MKLQVNKAQAAQRDRKLLAALAANFNSTAVLNLDGTPYKVKQLQKMLQDHVDAQAAADAQKAKWQTAVAGAQTKAVAVAGILPALRGHLISEYGSQSQIVADFNFTPKKKTTTVAAQAVGVAKRAATRKARGTMGKKQKSKITGAVAPEVQAAATTSTTDASTAGNGGAPKTAATS